MLQLEQGLDLSLMTEISSPPGFSQDLSVIKATFPQAPNLATPQSSMLSPQLFSTPQTVQMVIATTDYQLSTPPTPKTPLYSGRFNSPAQSSTPSGLLLPLLALLHPLGQEPCP